MKNIFIAMSIALMSFSLLQSCTYDKAVLLPVTSCQDTLNVSFNARIRPLLQGNCFSCHNNISNQGNVSLESYDQVKQLAISGRLLGSITHTDGFARMPLGAAKLNDCDIIAVSTWIQEGIKDN